MKGSFYMIFNTNKEKGRAGLSLAIAYFGSNGYTVSLPLNDTQDYDLIIDDGISLKKVQVKATGEKIPSGNYKCTLKTTSGTSRKKIGTVKESSADLLFCLTADSTMFLIPINEIQNSSTLTLSLVPPSKYANKNTLDTSKYIINL